MTTAEKTHDIADPAEADALAREVQAFVSDLYAKNGSLSAKRMGAHVKRKFGDRVDDEGDLAAVVSAAMLDARMRRARRATGMIWGAIAAFVAGLVALGVVYPQLITVFALALAVAGPIALKLLIAARRLSDG